MNVLVFASRKGGSGKTTLTAQLAAHVTRPAKPCLLIDTDPQGSLTLWHSLREAKDLPLKVAMRNLGDVVKAARREGIEWVFIDTPPNMSSVVTDAIHEATLVVIPARPGIFDISAVKETIATCRSLRTPYAVVINGAPAKRDGNESPLVSVAREELEKFRAPVWSGQITNRAGFLTSVGQGEGAKEYAPQSMAALDIARLWSAIEKSVRAINGAGSASGAMHKKVA